MPHNVKGTIELKALLLSQADTWQELTVIKAPVAFEGDTASVVASLPLKGLYGLIDVVSAQSGVTGAAYLADVQPVVRITGEVGGQAIEESFAPVLPFTVAPTVITLNEAVTAAPPGATYVTPSPASELAATLDPSQSGSVDHLVGNVVPFAKYDLDVGVLRVAGMILAGLAIALGLAHDVTRRRRSARSEEEQIALRYRCILVPVSGLNTSGTERIDVPAFVNLAGLAKFLERPILYDLHGDERTFAVDDDHCRYIYRSGPGEPTVVATRPTRTDGEASPAIGSAPVREHHRSRTAVAARGAAVVVVALAVSTTLVVSFTATTTVPATSAGSSAHALAISQLQPTGCNSLALTSLVVHSGTFSNSRSNVLILGGGGADTITDTGSGDCIVAGGGTNTVTGTSTDICITGPTLNIASACPLPSNGVTATPSEVGSGSYSGQELLLVTNTSSITAMTVTIVVQKTAGVTYNGESNSFPGGDVTQSSSSAGGTITYTTTLGSGKTIPAGGSATVYADFSGTGTARSYSGDTWSITSTSDSIVSTISGTF
jgi:hypothetical protein